MNQTGIKRALFGGTFNPPHIGHINAIETVKDRLSLDRVVVVPAFKSPLKEDTGLDVSPQQRLEMLRLGFDEDQEYIEVSDFELNRPSDSYTVETVKEMQKLYPEDDLYLVIGADQFEQFDRWKQFEDILSAVHLVVTSRPGHRLPRVKEQYAEGLQPFVDAIDRDFVMLSTGKHIHFIRREDIDVSSSDIRKKLRTGQSVARYLPPMVEDYIRERDLFHISAPKVTNYEDLAKFCATRLDDKKALNVMGFDLRGLELPTEYALVASGTSMKHASSLAENMVMDVKAEFGLSPFGVEGKGNSDWVVIDYGSLLVHVFYDYVRAKYNLEGLWQEAKPLKMPWT